MATLCAETSCPPAASNLKGISIFLNMCALYPVSASVTEGTEEEEGFDSYFPLKHKFLAKILQHWMYEKRVDMPWHKTCQMFLPLFPSSNPLLPSRGGEGESIFMNVFWRDLSSLLLLLVVVFDLPHLSMQSPPCWTNDLPWSAGGLDSRGHPSKERRGEPHWGVYVYLR